MQSYRFDIVRRKSDRFGWRVVAFDDYGERVIARSERSWRRRKKAKQAIEAIQKAPVCDTTRPRGDNGFDLPATRFGVVEGVVPLVVGDGPYVIRAARRQQAARDEAQAQQQALIQEGEEREKEEDAAAAEGRARIGRRSKKAE